ncbi:MAG: hypothetical protein RL670_192 [Actinomycetota bacterium]
MLRKSLTLLMIALFVTLGFFSNNPSFELGQTVTPQNISVSPRDLQLVCPGSVYRSAGDTGAAVGSFSQPGVARLSGSFTASGQGSVTARDISSTVVGSQPSGSVAGPLTLTAAGTNLSQSSALLNANQLQLVNDNRAAGLLATNCLPTENSHWLLAADTSTGRESLLVLNNPGSVNATVALELFGTSGKIVTAGQEGISVPARASTVVPVASLAPGLQAVVVHVISSASAISATLQQKTVRGLVAAGADLASPSTELAKELAIPGIFIRGVKDAAKLIASNPDYADLRPVLRVFLPADAKEPATVTAQIVGTDDKTFGTVVRATVNPGTVSDIPLNGLQDGNYSAFLTSNEKVRAAVRLSRTNIAQRPVTDFTWLQAATPISKDAAGITVPAAGISKLSIANPTRIPAKVSLSVDGSVRILSVPQQNSLVVEVPPNASITLSSDQPVAATLVIDVNFKLANLPLVNYQNLGSSLQVLVR